MKDRLLEFLRRENKTSALLAEEIGVQPSGISHILSGRNNPSLDFVLKMLEKYSFLSAEWLLFGKGKMYKESYTPSLFDSDGTDSAENLFRQTQVTESKALPAEPGGKNEADYRSTVSPSFSGREVIRIVWFYEDNSFDEFSPRK